MRTQDNCRRWLRENSYDDIADQIDEIMADWRVRGVKTRRNWWEILAGGKGGASRTVNGFQFPVLRTAQRRLGLPVTKNAIQRNRKETFPPLQAQPRWNSGTSH